MKNTDKFNPTIQKVLANHLGLPVKTASKRKVAEEAQDGVDSEFKVEDGGKSVDTDGIFSEFAGMAPSEGGSPIEDGQLDSPETPDGEESTFESYESDDEGGAETKKTQEDPGYQGASVTSDLSISGSTVEKGAAFLAKLQKFASTQKQFVTKLAAMAKFAEGMGEPMPERA